MWLADLGEVPFRSAPSPRGKFCISPFHLPNSQLHQPYSPHTKPAIPNHNFKPRLPITHCQPPQSASPSTSDIAFWPAFQQQRLLYIYLKLFVVFLSLKIQQTVQLESMGNGKMVVSMVNYPFSGANLLLVSWSVFFKKGNSNPVIPTQQVALFEAIRRKGGWHKQC